ncbi:MAG: hypothetical protein M1821_002457 [Bathelium mastoideum]|nr:MAG: hypothetical protein M1821_002457 [Bathelium mastoideum]
MSSVTRAGLLSAGVYAIVYIDLGLPQNRRFLDRNLPRAVLIDLPHNKDNAHEVVVIYDREKGPFTTLATYGRPCIFITGETTDSNPQTSFSTTLAVRSASSLAGSSQTPVSAAQHTQQSSIPQQTFTFSLPLRPAPARPVAPPPSSSSSAARNPAASGSAASGFTAPNPAASSSAASGFTARNPAASGFAASGPTISDVDDTMLDVERDDSDDEFDVSDEEDEEDEEDGEDGEDGEDDGAHDSPMEIDDPAELAALNPEVSFSLMRHPVDGTPLLINHKDSTFIMHSLNALHQSSIVTKESYMVLDEGEYSIKLPATSLRIILLPMPQASFTYRTLVSRNTSLFQRQGVDFQTDYYPEVHQGGPSSLYRLHTGPKDGQSVLFPGGTETSSYRLIHIGTLYASRRCTVNYVHHSDFPGVRIASHTPKIGNTDYGTAIEKARQSSVQIEALEALQHPNIVEFKGFDARTLTSYLEYPEGEALNRLDNRHYMGPEGYSLLLEREHVAHVLLDMSGALAHAHALGWHHGGINPGAVVYSRRAFAAKLLSWGGACRAAPASHEAAVLAAEDVYCLGCTARFAASNLVLARAMQAINAEPAARTAAFLAERDQALRVWSWAGANRGLSQLMLDMTSPAAADRPSAAVVHERALEVLLRMEQERAG